MSTPPVAAKKTEAQISLKVGAFSALFLGLAVTGFWNAKTSTSPRMVIAVGIALLGAAMALGILAMTPNVRREIHRWYRVRYFRTVNFVFDQFVTPKLIAIVTGGIALYNTVETFWGASEIFTQNPVLHRIGKIAAVVLLLLVAVLSYLRERAKEKNLQKTEYLFYKYVELVGAIVQQKILRFAEKAKDLPRRRRFDHVTQPTDQIRVIFKEGATFLRDVFDLQEKEIDFTIMERRGTADWSYLIKHQLFRTHTAAQDLFSVPSCARDAWTTGKPVFRASKKLAAYDEKYHVSGRDADEEDGSIYCAPVTVECPGITWAFVVSIVTYEQRFCDPHDKANCMKTEGLLREITRRIEMELHLRAMKST